MTQSPLYQEKLISLKASIGVLFFIIGSYVAVVKAAKVAMESSGNTIGDGWPTVYATFLLCAFIPGIYYTKNRDVAAKVWFMCRKAVVPASLNQTL